MIGEFVDATADIGAHHFCDDYGDCPTCHPDQLTSGPECDCAWCTNPDNEPAACECSDCIDTEPSDERIAALEAIYGADASDHFTDTARDYEWDLL